jgi:hypothetical protein
VPELWEGPAKYYVAEGPLATSVSEVSAAYFQECMHAGRGRARVVLADGTTELISGSRYLEPGTRIRVEEIEGHLEITYLGAVLRQYSDWLHYSDDVHPGPGGSPGGLGP